ncbi:MAG TPA: hypothetical protein VF809_03300 [Candidatus Saccharimonadales bacterium]
MKITDISQPQVAVFYGGAWDKTKAVSPDVSIDPTGRFVMHYVGTNCAPNERIGYRLLTCESQDGIVFKKHQQPLLDLNDRADKHYSPCLLRQNDSQLLFYGLGAQGKYGIAMARSSGGQRFTPDTNLVVDVGPHHNAAVHSPKAIIDVSSGKILCYYTGSHESGKIYSKQYPEYDFASGFALFRTTSTDARQFTSPEKVTIKGASFLNLYGHNVITHEGLFYLTFTGFDGSVNRLYLSVSSDGLQFTEPLLLVEPDAAKSELGVYSTSLVSLDDGRFRLYYGCRYFDNRWNILTRTFRAEG